MPRKSGNNNKKKVKRRDRNQKVTACEGCSKPLPKQDFVHCACTRVRFCSPSCQQEHPHKDCLGPPETTFNIDEKLEQARISNRRAGKTEEEAAKEYDENRETVSKPFQAYALQKGLQNQFNSDLSAWDLAKWADEGDSLGNQACAYLAASRFRHRMLSPPQRTGGRMIGNNRAVHNIPVLESEEQAFIYFRKAAKLGHGLSMQSLGTCFDDGVGCKENRRRCNQWLWRSVLHHSQGGIGLLDGRALLPLEVNANAQQLNHALPLLNYGQPMSLGGPNLASLLVVFLDILKIENYSFPPFAGTEATATVNNRPTATGPNDRHRRIPLIGAGAVRDLAQKVAFMKSRSHEIQFSYGRRGIAKAATAQTHGAASRFVDNQLFCAPPAAASDERVTDEGYQRWYSETVDLSYSYPERLILPFCVHVEQTGTRQVTSPFCGDCEAQAKERLEAVARGSAILSVDENIPHRGQAAMWRKPDGTLQAETWKSYAGGEAECVLATIAASKLSPYAYPIFIAQDPNFFWPLIYDHGCIRAALEFVAPHIDWDEKIGPVKENNNERSPIIPGCKPGDYLRKCGNNSCNNLELYSAIDFQKCGNCERRFYCSEECIRADWPVHKFECKKTSSSPPANPRLDIIMREETPKSDSAVKTKHKTEIKEGDDVVVHGLKAKPEYNGIVGVVTRDADGKDGRIAVTLRSQAKNVISISPANLYCMGVFYKSRKKKANVFECVHGEKVCSTCYIDFSTVNRLMHLKHYNQDFTSPGAIDQVNDIYFSSFEIESEEVVSACEEEWPIECIGMANYEKQRFVLRALVNNSKEDQTTSLHAAVACAAHITFGAATHPVLRAFTRLDKVAQML